MVELYVESVIRRLKLMDTQKKTLRELKFRAWDKTVGMYMVSDLEFIACGQIRALPYYKRDEKPDAFGLNPIVMQYTGLKDKNDQEIYEGDIVQPIYTKTGYGRKQEVRWGIGAWEPFDGNCDSEHSNRYEVIGNVYENLVK